MVSRFYPLPADPAHRNLDVLYGLSHSIWEPKASKVSNAVVNHKPKLLGEITKTPERIQAR